MSNKNKINKQEILGRMVTEEDYGNITPQMHNHVCKKWEESGGSVVHGQAHLLLLDFDRQEDLDQLEDRLEMFKVLFGSATIEDKYQSKSGGVHVVIRTKKAFDPLMRIALQACLGSDLKREMYSVARCRNKVLEPSVLFKPKNEMVELKVTKK